jgi:hypothetical protein
MLATWLCAGVGLSVKRFRELEDEDDEIIFA